MATVALVTGTAYICPLIFANDTGTTGPGPMGAVTSSDPNVSVGLAADFQSVNLIANADSADAVITWSDPSGAIPSATLEITASSVVTPPPFVATSVAFGTPVPV